MSINRKNRLIAVLTALIFMLTVFISFEGISDDGKAYGATETSVNRVATINNGPLNVRSGPGTNYSKMGTIAKGKTITVLTQTQNSSGQVWYKFQYSSGKYGYVLSNYVKMSDVVSESVVNKVATIKNGPLNVRSGPGTNYSKLGTIAKGKSVTILTQVKNSSGNIWYKYQYSSGKYGYIYSDYVTLGSSSSSSSSSSSASYSETALSNTTAYIKNGPLNVRSGPGTNYSKMGTVAKGKTVTVVAKAVNSSGNVWYKYQYSSGKYGYIFSDYVTIKTVQPVTETAVNKTATIKNGPLNVRSGPGTNYSKLGTVAKGKTITILTQVKNSSGNIWYKYQYSSGKYGYILSDYVTLNNDVETPLTNKTATVIDGPLNIRSGPGTDYSKLGQLQEGKTVTLISQVKNAWDNVWYKYQYDGNKYGYIYSDYVKVNDNTPTAPPEEETPTEPEQPEAPAPAVTTEVGTITTDSGYTLNVRKGPGTDYGKIGSLNSKATIVIIGSEKASNGKVWYKFQYSSSQVGYVCSDYVSVKTVTSTSDFEAQLSAQGFPESYKPMLRALHAAHPEWVFKGYNVGCTWADAVARENAAPDLNVISSSSPTSQRSKDSDCYNASTGVWGRYDGGWYSAHTKVIEYYMDPRNFLDETGIFQFMTHKYDASTQNASTVSAVVKGTFMETRNPGGGYSSYAALINDAGKAANVNPNVLAAMIIQEQGTNGSSRLISGTCAGYEGYYNFFNVGAYTTSTMTAVERGLWYASQSGSYSRPWNSVYKSILGGAQFYGAGYVNNNQDTYYTKKFNVKNGVGKIGTHQYMTNVAGAYGEGKLLSKAFTSGGSQTLVFEIPIYNSMPATPCTLP